MGEEHFLLQKQKHDQHQRTQTRRIECKKTGCRGILENILNTSQITSNSGCYLVVEQLNTKNAVRMVELVP